MSLRQAPTRNVAVVIAVVLAFALTGLTLLLSAWMGAIQLAPGMRVESVSITDVHFGKGYMILNVSVAEGSVPAEIKEVRVTELNQTYYHQLTDRVINATVNERIPAGEHVIIIICNEWTSGYTYQIKLTSARTNQFTEYAVAP